MFYFGKKRREAEQLRKIEQLLDDQKQFLALYEQPTRLTSQQDELRAVRDSFEQAKTSNPR